MSLITPDTLKYTIQNLLDIQQYLDMRVVDLGTRFKNYKYYLLKKNTDLRRLVTNSIAWNNISQNLIRYNLLSNPGCWSTTYDSCILIDGESYDSSVTETLMGRVSTKVRVKVCTTYTIDDEETTTCEYQLRDAFLTNSCIINYENLDQLVNNIQVFANPVS